MQAGFHRGTIAAITLGIVGGALGARLVADHAWGTYHWARKTSSFSLTVVNSTTNDWDPFVERAVYDWSQSTVLDMVQDPTGSLSDHDRRKCSGPAGRLRICNLAYGRTGWLGIAGISVDSNGHITSGYTKLNDTYFSTSYYNKHEWKQSVTCQELGHNVGLDHQDENFNNTSLLSCMDYQDPPYPSPNQHDYDQLRTMYAHKDAYNSYSSTGASSSTGTSSSTDGGTCKGSKCEGATADADDGNTPASWGISLGRRGQKETFLRIDRDGTRHLTHVTWAIDDGDGKRR